VTVVEPGPVETPLIHVYPEAERLVTNVIPIDPRHIARIIRFALEQPTEVDLFEGRGSSYQPDSLGHVPSCR